MVFDTGNMFYKDISQLGRETPLLQVRSPLIVDSLNSMGYDAANVGWMDLLLPGEMLAGAASQAAFPFLSANLRDASGNAPFEPYLIKEFDGLRVGVIGLVSHKEHAGVKGRQSPYRVLDPVETAGTLVKKLGNSCDIIVALTSLGLEDDRRLARSVEGIDVILGGLSKKVMYQAEVEGETIILQAGSRGMRMGTLEIEISPGKGGSWVLRKAAVGDEAKTYAWSPVSLSKGIKDHPGITARLEEYRDVLKEEEIARKVSPPPGSSSRYAGAEQCRTCHPREGKQWDATSHARAFKTLLKKGQDGNPDCLGCHVTAFRENGGYRPGSEDPDLAAVQCEACHGAGRSHKSRGMIDLRVPVAICRGCHNTENSPTFRYEEYLKILGEHTVGYFRRPPELR
jgi:predicted CXXCH cytochrome family protein